MPAQRQLVPMFPSPASEEGVRIIPGSRLSHQGGAVLVVAGLRMKAAGWLGPVTAVSK